MTSGKYIQNRFQAWAAREGIVLQGSAGERGAPNYTLTVAENLFGGVMRHDVAAAFEAGAGGELKGSIPTISALHSSAPEARPRTQMGRKTANTRLLYLYYDAPGPEASERRKEILQFQEAIAGDPIGYVPIPVQKFIIRAFEQVRGTHSAYVDYLTDRYL